MGMKKEKQKENLYDNEKGRFKNIALYIPTDDEKETHMAIKKILIDPLDDKARNLLFDNQKIKIPSRHKSFSAMLKSTEVHFKNRRDSDVTDDKFFEMISENPSYLGDRFSQEKIQRWQKELHDEDKAFKAEEKLK